MTEPIAILFGAIIGGTFGLVGSFAAHWIGRGARRRERLAGVQAELFTGFLVEADKAWLEATGWIFQDVDGVETKHLRKTPGEERLTRVSSLVGHMELVSPPRVYQAAEDIRQSLYVGRYVGNPPRKETEAEQQQSHDDARQRLITEAGKELRG